MAFGVYIHFPYCLKRCPYCDFAIHVRKRIPHREYADAVERELFARAPLYEGRALSSIYFGGGTPGLWEPSCIARVADAVKKAFPVEKAVEVTVEVNPEAMERETIAALREAGVNRLSVGAQSLDPRQLDVLGRPHRAGDVRATVEAARAAGFDNLSLDLIFGVPAQTIADLDRDLDGLLALSPDHLSVYNLTVEERTPFGAAERAGALKLPDSGVQADMFERASERARAAGFEHYEISSYARAGRRAVHNTLYWTAGEWLGLGCAAHSFRRVADGGGERWSNVRSVDAWLRAMPEVENPLLQNAIVASYQRLDDDSLAREAIWLGLRLLQDGVDRARFAARFGSDPVLQFAREWSRLAEEGLVAVDGARARLTRRGALFADEVGARFI